jgi:hypothetical protein
MDDRRICGTARLHAEAYGNADRLRRGLRALAKGDRASARELVPARFARGPGSTASVEASAYLFATLALEAGTGSESAREEARQALVARAASLDEEIARPAAGDLAMWRARSMVERSQVALALGDAVRAAALVEGAIAALSALWGAEHLEVGSYWDDFATALFAQGRASEAEAALARARSIYESKGYSYKELG